MVKASYRLKLMECFSDEDRAREFMEKLRWPDGPICPHCGSNKAYRLNGHSTSKSPGRKGLLKCGECRKQYSVTVGTVFERSRIPLGKWLYAIHLMCASKKGVSANQLAETLGITYKSAWFMAHRVRTVMAPTPVNEKLGGIVEADETYIGGRIKGKRGRGALNKTEVFALIQRNGRALSCRIDSVKAKTLQELTRDSVQIIAQLMTDN